MTTKVCDKYLVAYVVCNPLRQPTKESLRQFLLTQVPEYMIPASFVCVDALPLTPSGKIDRAALAAPNAVNSLEQYGANPPRNAFEERLSEILSALLGVKDLSTDENFFLLGGHSLLATRLIARVREAFQVDLSLRTIFDSPTVAELSAEVERLVCVRLANMTDEEAEQVLKAALQHDSTALGSVHRTG